MNITEVVNLDMPVGRLLAMTEQDLSTDNKGHTPFTDAFEHMVEDIESRTLGAAGSYFLMEAIGKNPWRSKQLLAILTEVADQHINNLIRRGLGNVLKDLFSENKEGAHASSLEFDLNDTLSKLFGETGAGMPDSEQENDQSAHGEMDGEGKELDAES